MVKNKLIQVQGNQISITSYNEKDYICLTDMAKAFEEGSSLIENWLRNKNTVEFLGVWERLNNPNFNSVEFDGIMMQVGLNRFKLSAKKWAETTNAIGIVAKTGKYGGTYAHTDIAYHFGMWLSPEFNLLVIKEFQRFKEEESKSLKSAEWLHHRFTAKANYTIQTDAVQKFIIPNTTLPKEKHGIIYASEAELINFGTLGYTAKEWSDANPELAKKSNLRDYLEIEELVVLDSMQTFNSYLISQGEPKEERLKKIQVEAQRQLESLKSSRTISNAKLAELKVNRGEFDNLLLSMSNTDNKE